MQNSRKQLLQKNLFFTSKRQYQYYSRNYLTGFDRMLYDKLTWTGIGGHLFALFGIANLVAYGAHFLMDKDQYKFHFAYQ